MKAAAPLRSNAPSAKAPRLLTEDDVARMLRCSREKVRKLRRDGLLAFIPGRPVMIAEADLSAYLDARSNDNADAGRTRERRRCGHGSGASARLRDVDQTEADRDVAPSEKSLVAI